MSNHNCNPEKQTQIYAQKLSGKLFLHTNNIFENYPETSKLCPEVIKIPSNELVDVADVEGRTAQGFIKSTVFLQQFELKLEGFVGSLGGKELPAAILTAVF